MEFFFSFFFEIKLLWRSVSKSTLIEFSANLIYSCEASSEVLWRYLWYVYWNLFRYNKIQTKFIQKNNKMELLIVITTYERTPIPHPINTLPMSSHQQFYGEICESNLSDELRSKRYTRGKRRVEWNLGKGYQEISKSADNIWYRHRLHSVTLKRLCANR